MIPDGSKSQGDDKRFKRGRPLPGPLLSGRGVAARLEETLAPLGLTGSVLIVADAVTARFAGSQEAAGIHIITEASVDEVERVERAVSRRRPRLVAGLGGGRPIDVAKLAAFRRGLPFISVPTSPSHDGVASGRASLVHLGARTSIGARPPAAVVADLDILEGAPPRLISSGIADLVSNLTAVLDWELARSAVGEDFDEEAARLSRQAGEEASSMNGRIEGPAMSALMSSLVKSGTAMAMCGTSRPASGSEHKFSHALDALGEFNALHGETCGLGAVMMMAMHEGDWRGMRDALAAAGAPTTAKELGISSDSIIDALVKAREIRPERYTILEHVAPDRAALAELAAEVGVIDAGRLSHSSGTEGGCR